MRRTAIIVGLLIGASLALTPAGRYGLAGVIVLFAPGYLAWSWLGRDLRLPHLAAPAVWLALSLSLIPIWFLWHSTLGIALTPAVLRFQAAALMIVAAWRVYRQGQRPRAPRWLWLSLIGLLSLVGLTRALQIRGIALPLWVDSLHHTLLVRIVGETGRIPTSLQPYLPVEHLVYHWGFHTIVATWRGLAELDLPTAVLWSGQVLNALMALQMYALGSFLLRSPRAGLLAAGVVGLLSLLPAYYVTWGRYTQLTGLLVLPVLMLASLALAERRIYSWRLVVLVSLLVAGLMIIHYRVLAFYAAFMIAYGVVTIVQSRRMSDLLLRFGSGLTGAAILVAPWAAEVFRQAIAPVAQQPSRLAGPASYNSVDWGLLQSGNQPVLFVLAGASTLLAIWQRRWRVIIIAMWVLTLLLLANPTIVGLPSSWFITNHTVQITLFLPVGVLVAAGLNELLRWFGHHLSHTRRALARSAAWLLLSGLALLGTWQLRTVINPATILATPADRRAIEWAIAQTPANGRWLVNSTHWVNGAPRGTDGGWWLLPLGGRWVTTPPALYIYGSPAYKQQVEALNRRIAALSPTDQAALEQLVRDAHINYIFIGQRGGPIKPDLLWSNPRFLPIYDEEGVTIFAVRPEP
ncbi:DUF6541 family protein [Kallotenue papyrolyticum]|uniref:DUF6541 family protein n=1 Tax=Kallotenue papyrolyticum TaxID=1325125 RepID=UPI000478610B|nr:DUF6541 family protein [Kallotenue papyrolyticum]